MNLLSLFAQFLFLPSISALPLKPRFFKIEYTKTTKSAVVQLVVCFRCVWSVGRLGYVFLRV